MIASVVVVADESHDSHLEVGWLDWQREADYTHAERGR